MLPQVIATLARGWVDAALQARVKAAPPPPVERSEAFQQVDQAFNTQEPEPSPPPASSEPPSPAPTQAKEAELPLKAPPLPEPATPTPPAEEPGPRPQVLALEAGASLYSRSFSYSMVATMNLRSYSAYLLLEPDVRVEVYPLALLTKGLLSGLGVDGSFGTAIGARSRRSGTDATWPTTLMHFEMDARYRWTPVRSVDAAVIPFAGVGNRRFEVGLGSDGSALDVPGTSYWAVRVGVAGELPIVRTGVLVFAKLAALIVVSSGQIISADYFPTGSTFGFETELGVGYQLFGPLQLRLAFDYTRYGLTFQTTASDVHVASGAADLYMGGHFGVRLVF